MKFLRHWGNRMPTEITFSVEAKQFIRDLLFELQITERFDRLEKLVNKLAKKQEKIMADLNAEFTALGAALDRAVAEINSEITDLAAAVASGADAAAVVEDARGKITAATDKISGVADALAADNPPVA